MAEKGNSRKIRNDVILIAVLALLIGILAGAMILFREEGTMVVVKIDNKEYGRYPLSKNQTITIVSGENNEYYNILVIENGEAYVSEANCPGRLAWTKCTNQPKISHTNESIICKEHHLSIEIENSDPDVQEDDDDVPDIIS